MIDALRHAERPPLARNSESVLSFAAIRSWLPALVVLIGMPLLALATTKYILLPPLQSSLAGSSNPDGEASESQNLSHVFIAKISLPAASAGSSRAGIASIALIGGSKNLRNKVDQNKARLTALGLNDLNGLTADDLYKPAILDATRAQLMADFNRALGEPLVKEVCIPLFSR